MALVGLTLECFMDCVATRVSGESRSLLRHAIWIPTKDPDGDAPGGAARA
jgi:hypothetical protein